VEEIARIARSRGVTLHTDAVQALGKIPVRIGDLGADLVSVSGHKIYGPKGIGALLVKKGTPLSPLVTGGGQERGLRAGTENVAAIAGFAEAVVLATSSLSETAARLETLRGRLESQIIGSLRGVRVNGGAVKRVPNTSSLSFASVDGESIALGLEFDGICVSTGSACATGDPEPSHVLLAMGMSRSAAQGSIRVSLGKDTT
jgi:cysteine desulfurase